MTAGFPIQHIILEQGAEGFDSSSEIIERLPGIPLSATGIQDEPSFEMDKRSLRLLSFPGKILKPCPGTREYICCGYHILHAGINCPMDCSYCILQAYINQPSLRVFVNLEERLQELGDFLERHPEKCFRIGTGEFTDSLALDPIVHWTDFLVPFFSGRRNAVLELKTKTDHIEGLLRSNKRDRIVVSWSLNSPFIAASEEHGAPALERRLRSARRCQREGLVLGFHFDPMIHYPGWKEGYKRTVELLDRYIDPKGIIWISMGAFRFMPALKAIIRKRHPRTKILDSEFVPGLDGKMRYFKPIRLELYALIAEMLSTWHRDLGLYLCMEGHDVWEKSLGWSPGHSEGLSWYLDGRVKLLMP